MSESTPCGCVSRHLPPLIAVSAGIWIGTAVVAACSPESRVPSSDWLTTRDTIDLGALPEAVPVDLQTSTRYALHALRAVSAWASDNTASLAAVGGVRTDGTPVVLLVSVARAGPDVIHEWSVPSVPGWLGFQNDGRLVGVDMGGGTYLRFDQASAIAQTTAIPRPTANAGRAAGRFHEVALDDGLFFSVALEASDGQPRVRWLPALLVRWRRDGNAVDTIRPIEGPQVLWGPAAQLPISIPQSSHLISRGAMGFAYARGDHSAVVDCRRWPG